MSRVRDLWHRRDRTRTARYGRGDRWLAVRTDGAGGEQTRAFSVKAAAEAWAYSTDVEAAPAVATTMAEWAEVWQSRQVHQRASSRAVIRARTVGDITPTLGHLRVVDVTRAHVQDAVIAWQGRGLAPATVRLSYAYLASMLREAVLDGIIPASPCVGVRLPAATGRGVDVLTVEQVQQIADNIAPWARDAVLLAAATGLRPGELRGLTVDRVDLGAGVITVDRQISEDAHGWAPLKTAASRRTVRVGPVTVQVLARMVDGADLEGRLLHYRGSGWLRTRASDVWGACRKQLDWMGPGGWHLLRHHHASVLLSEGASVVAVARRLGHKTAAETIRTYAHVMPHDDELLVGLTDGLVR